MGNGRPAADRQSRGPVVRKKGPPSKKKATRPSIPLDVRCMLWGCAGGRCQYSSCNRPVHIHPRSKETANLADAAHIIGCSASGPRGEHQLSAALAKDLSNLLLMCKICARVIDKNKAKYPVNLLRRWKREHEERVRTATGITPDKKTSVVLFGADIGDMTSPLSGKATHSALFPHWYPAAEHPIELGFGKSGIKDRDATFWKSEADNLHSQFKHEVQGPISTGKIEHLSIFAIAPQPLLMYLGSLMTDLTPVEVYQRRREPATWTWKADSKGFDYVCERPTTATGTPALVLALSATITDTRITSVLPGASIWRITHANPNNDFLKERGQLERFRQVFRGLLDEIKAQHGEGVTLHVFPAVPVAVAVEAGRVRMPKADLPFRIYDQQSERGFIHVMDIGISEQEGA
jgi:hypothetical protein